LQGIEAVERGKAEAIDPADDGSVALPSGDGARGTGEHLGRGRAGGRDGDGHTRELQALLKVAGDGIGVLRLGIGEPVRQRGIGAASGAVGELGLLHPGSRSADEHADPCCAVALAQGRGGNEKPVLL